MRLLELRLKKFDNIKINIIDILIIIIQLSSQLSIISSFFDSIIPLPYLTNLLVVMILGHIIRFGAKIKLWSLLSKHLILRIYILIFIFDIIQNLLTIPGNSFVRLVLFIDIFLFMDYLYQIVNENNNSNSSTRTIALPYITYSIYNVLVVLLLVVFIILGVTSPFSNPVEFSMMGDNIEGGQLYYYPMNLSIVTQDSRFLSNYGIPMLCGLSHEPHVLALLVTPGLFFLLANFDIKLMNKLFFIMLYFIALLCGQSTTAIICFFAVIGLHLLYSFILKKKSLPLVISTITFILVLTYASAFLDSLVDMLISKTNDDGGSMSYSSAMLSYIVSPQSILGYGNLPPAVGDKVLQYDIGLITCVLDVSLYVMLFIRSLKMVFSKYEHLHYIGLGVLYFCIHGLKISYIIFWYPYLAYILIILCLSYDKAYSKISNY